MAMFRYVDLAAAVGAQSDEQLPVSRRRDTECAKSPPQRRMLVVRGCRGMLRRVNCRLVLACLCVVCCAGWATNQGVVSGARRYLLSVLEFGNGRNDAL